MIFIWYRKIFSIKSYQHPQDIWGQLINWKFFKTIFSTSWKPRKCGNSMKFCQKFQFLTFVIFVAEISNKQFCKLNKILRNFCSWQFFVFVTVSKIFGFETRNFKKWSCDTLEHCTRNHIALLFHLELLEITSRCYSTWSCSKSHRVAIPLRVNRSHIALLFHWNYSKSHRVAISLLLFPQITPRCYFQPIRALIAGFSLANNTIPW